MVYSKNEGELLKDSNYAFLLQIWIHTSNLENNNSELKRECDAKSVIDKAMLI